MPEELQIRIEGDASHPALIYLPGLHGDWTLIGSFKAAMKGKVRFVEFTYPRTLTWGLKDYADQIESCLLTHGITNGWLLGESYGSQIVWPLAHESAVGRCGFKVEGIILAGGFLKHPNILGVYFAKHFSGSLPRGIFEASLRWYARYAAFRHRRAPETLFTIREFVARRTELDRSAMKHRLGLIAANDPRAIARSVRVPVYALSGFWDPIVPRLLTRLSLRKNCPGYVDAKTIMAADHNVLGTEPKAAADIICGWINKKGRS